MADIIEINIKTLANDIKELEAEVAKLRSEMAKAYVSVAELDTMWKGPANEEFRKAFQSDREAMEEMCKIIDGLIAYMENAKGEYRRCEAAVSSESDAIRI